MLYCVFKKQPYSFAALFLIYIFEGNIFLSLNEKSKCSQKTKLERANTIRSLNLKVQKHFDYECGSNCYILNQKLDKTLKIYSKYLRKCSVQKCIVSWNKSQSLIKQNEMQIKDIRCKKLDCRLTFLNEYRYIPEKY